MLVDGVQYHRRLLDRLPQPELLQLLEQHNPAVRVQGWVKPTPLAEQGNQRPRGFLGIRGSG